MSKRKNWMAIVVATLAVVGLDAVSFAQIAKPQVHSTNLQKSSGYLGLGVQGLDAGLTVTLLTPGGPAAVAGVRLNDVILEMNGQKTGTAEQFTESIIGKAPGTKVTLTIERGGAKQTLTATLGVRPLDLPMTGPSPGTSISTPFGPMMLPDGVTMPDAPKVGFAGEPLGPQLAEFFGVQEGVLVQMVYEKTPAERAGMKAGDVVTKVNGMPVASPREISGIVRQAKKTAVFTVVRNKKEITLSVEISWNFNDRAFCPGCSSLPPVLLA